MSDILTNLGGETVNNNLMGKLNQICSNNVWRPAASQAELFRKSDTTYGGNRAAIDQVMKQAEIGASVDDVASALQASVLSTIGSDLSDTVVAKATGSEIINGAVSQLVGVTSDMTPVQRQSIAEAFGQTAANFKASKSALKKFLKNTDESKSEGLEQDYASALEADFRKQWKATSGAAKEIAATIGVSKDGTPNTLGEALTDQNPRLRTGANIRTSNSLYEKIAALNEMNLSRFHNTLAKWYLGCSIDLPTIVSLDQAGVLTPFGAFLFRPFQSFNMGSGIVVSF